MCKKTLRKVFFLVFLLNLSVYTLVAQEDKKPGGGWSVGHYVDEFGDKTPETYYITSPKAGAYFYSLFGRVEGTVKVLIDGSTLRLIFCYKNGRQETWLRETYQLSVKDTNTGEVVYRELCYKADGANLFWRINPSLKEALHSPHRLQFVVQYIYTYTNDSPDPIGGFSMTGELPK
jgi:hypothetical protein